MSWLELPVKNLLTRKSSTSCFYSRCHGDSRCRDLRCAASIMVSVGWSLYETIDNEFKLYSCDSFVFQLQIKTPETTETKSAHRNRECPGTALDQVNKQKGNMCHLDGSERNQERGCDRERTSNQEQRHEWTGPDRLWQRTKTPGKYKQSQTQSHTGWEDEKLHQKNKRTRIISDQKSKYINVTLKTWHLLHLCSMSVLKVNMWP